MKILSKAQKNISFWFLLITSFIFFLLRLPSLFEPNWYGDEGIYQVIGIALRHGRLLYRDIWDNKPPLLYLLYSLFNSDQFAVRLASLIFGVATIIAFFYLSKKLFSNNKIIFLTTALFALLFGLPLLEGNIANAENFMLLPIISAGLLILKLIEKKTPNAKYLFFSGVLLSLASLFKIVSLFDFAALFTFVAILNAPKDIKRISTKEIKVLLPLALGFIIPHLATFLFFVLKGDTRPFIQASFLQNVGYVGYGNKFFIPQGLLIIKLLVLFSFSLFIFLKRFKLSTSSIFVLLWFAFSLFNAFFAGRPYTHYLLVLLPSFCLLVGLIIQDAKLRKFTALLFLISLFLILKNFNYYGKTIYYYQNFISFLTNHKSVYSYRIFFDAKTPRDYEIVSFIKSHTKSSDSIFLWGNNAQVYAMTGKLPPGRYAVAYHITGYKDGIENTQNGIAKEKLKFIIVMPGSSQIPFSIANYKETKEIENVLIYERVF